MKKYILENLEFSVSKKKEHWPNQVWMGEDKMSILEHPIPLMSRLIIILARTLKHTKRSVWNLDCQEAMFAVASPALLLCDKPVSQITALRQRHLTKR